MSVSAVQSSSLTFSSSPAAASVSASAIRFHKKRLVIQNGKELDLLASPARLPLCCTKTAATTVAPLPLAPNPPSYWSGHAAAAARRTREVADELYWAAVERGDNAAVAESGLTMKARAAVAASRRNTGTPCSMAFSSTLASSTAAPSSFMRRSASVLDHVSNVTTMPLSRTKVAAELRNLAADGVVLAVRGRAQWEHNHKRNFGTTAMVRAVEGAAAAAGALSRPATASGGLLRSPSSLFSSPAASRPGTAGTINNRGNTRPSTAGSMMSEAASGSGGGGVGAGATTSIQHIAHIFAPNNQNRLHSVLPPGICTVMSSRPASAAAVSVVSSSHPSGIPTLSFEYRSRPSSAAIATGQQRWKEFDSAFHSPIIANREIFEFERRAATSERFKKSAQVQQQTSTTSSTATGAVVDKQQQAAAAAAALKQRFEEEERAAKLRSERQQALKMCNDAKCLEDLHHYATCAT